MLALILALVITSAPIAPRIYEMATEPTPNQVCLNKDTNQFVSCGEKK